MFICSLKKKENRGVFSTPIVVVALGTNVENARRGAQATAGTGIGIGMHCPLAS